MSAAEGRAHQPPPRADRGRRPSVCANMPPRYIFSVGGQKQAIFQNRELAATDPGPRNIGGALFFLSINLDHFNVSAPLDGALHDAASPRFQKIRTKKLWPSENGSKNRKFQKNHKKNRILETRSQNTYTGDATRFFFIFQNDRFRARNPFLRALRAILT